MRFGLWVAFFLICNVLGVEAFRAALTLPFEDALLPAVLSIPLVGLTAFGATRLLSTWREWVE
ncbi:MAG TPA: hypothetical protein VFU40_12040 [Gemmatimonadales bacterium]|nr:hypothetical protein [Gemmatimonadales bacterium]